MGELILSPAEHCALRQWCIETVAGPEPIGAARLPVVIELAARLEGYILNGSRQDRSRH